MAKIDLVCAYTSCFNEATLHISYGIGYNLLCSVYSCKKHAVEFIVASAQTIIEPIELYNWRITNEEEINSRNNWFQKLWKRLSK